MKILFTILTKLILTVLFFLVFLVLLITYYFWSNQNEAKEIERLISEKCSQLERTGSRNFVGQQLSIAPEIVRYCHPIERRIDSDYDPAQINIGMHWPEFNSQKEIKNSKILILLFGIENGAYQYRELAFTPFDEIRGENKRIYDILTEQKNIKHYEKNKHAYPIHPNDVYVYEFDDEIKFILECKMKSSTCGCRSKGNYFLKNVRYVYCYPEELLPHALEIHQKIDDYLNSIIDKS